MNKQRVISISKNMRTTIIRKLRAQGRSLPDGAEVSEIAKMVAKHFRTVTPKTILGQASMLLRYWQKATGPHVTLEVLPFVPLRMSREMTYALERTKELRPDQ